MSHTKVLFILFAAFLSLLLTGRCETSAAEKPEVKVYLFFAPEYDAGLELIGPGRGVSFLETESPHGPPDKPCPGLKPGYPPQREPEAPCNPSLPQHPER